MTLKKTIGRIALLCLIAATLLFIFIQSMLPPETSSAESDAVGGVIEEIIPSDTPAGSYIQLNLRKIAHFVEFAVLGVEVALYVAFFMRKPHFIALSYIAALVTALFDESVQIFSKRGPAIFDVWIDFFGFFIFASIVYFTFFTVEYFYKKVQMRKEKLGNGKNN